MRNGVMIGVMVAMVLASCAVGDQGVAGDGSTGPDRTTAATSPPEQSATTSTDGANGEVRDGETPPVGWPEVDAMVVAAREDLADRLSVDMDAIDVVRVESVMWPSGAIGCPEPRMSYTQALVEGVRIELSSDGSSYWYHQGGSHSIHYCEDPDEPVDGPQQDAGAGEIPGGSKFIPPTTTP